MVGHGGPTPLALWVTRTCADATQKDQTIPPATLVPCHEACTQGEGVLVPALQGLPSPSLGIARGKVLRGNMIEELLELLDDVL